jgi:hypothetical protein
MRFLLLLLVLGLAAWFYADRSYAVATPETQGPVQVAASGCAPPQPSEKAAMVFAGFYDGAAMSSVELLSANSQREGTTAVDVRIAAGFQPIYLLIAGSRGAVVRLSGWTRRVERLVLVGDEHYPVGATGIPASRISIVDRHACLIDAQMIYGAYPGQNLSDLSGIVKRPQPAGLSREERMKRPLYRMPDAVGGAYKPYRITIGAGSVSASEYKAHESDTGLPEWQKVAAEFVPAGLKDVKPAQLVANVPAKPYALLPGWMGLAQLVRDGKLEPRGFASFRVLGPIEIPAGLYGGDSVDFHLAPGVPTPTGDPGTSRIIPAG